MAPMSPSHPPSGAPATVPGRKPAGSGPARERSGSDEPPARAGAGGGPPASGGGGASRRLLAPLPGVALAATLGAVASVLSGWIGVDLLGYAQSPLSPILLTVLLGLLVRNTVGVPGVYEPGLQLCVTRLLRIGVALLGIRLSLVAAGSTGLVALPIVIVCIAAALLLVGGLTRLLKLPPRLGSLVAVGTSICGITAIVAISPVIGADEDETSYAVATIALFGMATLFVYPFLAHLIFDDPTHAGLFLGTSIHDTSQVAGAALAYQQQYGAPEALDTAVVTKLVRNLCMVAVIPLMAMLYRRREKAGSGTGVGGLRLKGAVPLFILGFLAMTALRTIGDMGERPFGLLAPESWEAIIALVQQAAEIALLLSMAAVGLGTSLRRLYVLGLRPLAVGLVAAVSVGVVSVALIRLFIDRPLL